jgi:hypothetical protein
MRAGYCQEKLYLFLEGKLEGIVNFSSYIYGYDLKPPLAIISLIRKAYRNMFSLIYVTTLSENLLLSLSKSIPTS